MIKESGASQSGIKTDQTQKTSYILNTIKAPSGEKMLLDGSSEIDDIVLASCFAMRDRSMLEQLNCSMTTLGSDERSKNGASIKSDAASRAKIERSFSSQESAPNDDSDDSGDDVNMMKAPCEPDMSEDSASLTALKHDIEELNEKNDDLETETSNDFSGLKIQGCSLTDIPTNLDEAVQLTKVGTITAVVENLVIVKAEKTSLPLNVETIICLENREVLGIIADTFGPVQSPFHAICMQNKSKKVFFNMGDGVFADLSTSNFLTDENHKPFSYLYEKFETESASDDTSEDESLEKKMNRNIKPVVRSTLAFKAKKKKARKTITGMKEESSPRINYSVKRLNDQQLPETSKKRWIPKYSSLHAHSGPFGEQILPQRCYPHMYCLSSKCENVCSVNNIPESSLIATTGLAHDIKSIGSRLLSVRDSFDTKSSSDMSLATCDCYTDFSETDSVLSANYNVHLKPPFIQNMCCPFTSSSVFTFAKSHSLYQKQVETHSCYHNFIQPKKFRFKEPVRNEFYTFRHQELRPMHTISDTRTQSQCCMNEGNELSWKPKRESFRKMSRDPYNQI